MPRDTKDHDTKDMVAELLAPMLKKTLVAASAGEIEPFVTDHLAYMNGLEADGRLWASGPACPARSAIMPTRTICPKCRRASCQTRCRKA